MKKEDSFSSLGMIPFSQSNLERCAFLMIISQSLIQWVKLTMKTKWYCHSIISKVCLQENGAKSFLSLFFKCAFKVRLIELNPFGPKCFYSQSYIGLFENANSNQILSTVNQVPV